MKIFSTIKETKDCIVSRKKHGNTIGFVPTMGALHRGHISLIEKAKRENDFVVSSIFVNPLQFNDKKDLERYPRTFEEDKDILIQSECDLLFIPTSDEMYPNQKSESLTLNLGNLDKVMEGALRSGHFQGVCIVVKKLFDIVEPNKAYFGEKDFQQLAVIKHMVKELHIPVEVISCPTVREPDGLAMSSRNMLLNPDERKNASCIPQTLFEAKKIFKNGNVEYVKKWVEGQIKNNPLLLLEYFEMVDAETLTPVSSRMDSKNIRACIAVKIDSIRLIDNIQMS